MAFGSTGTQDRGTRGNNGQNPGRESPLRKFTKCCFFIACFVCLTLVDCIDNLDPRDSDAPKELKEPKIRSLPVRRKRALTLPLSTSKDQIKLWKKQRTKDQLQSLLFSRLNYDIRRIIYEYLLCVPKGRELHVAVSSSMSWGKPSSERVSGIPCHARQPDGPSCWHSCWLPDDLLYQSRRDRPLPENPCVISLGLLRSCRQIYTEAIDVLYTKNTSNIRQLRALTHLPNVMIPHRLASIKSLHIDPLPTDSSYLVVRPGSKAFPRPFYFISKWHESCAMIAKMDGLQNLQVDFRIERNFENRWPDKDELLCVLIGPLLQLRVSRFRVTAINWGEDLPQVRALVKNSDAPFLFEETENRSPYLAGSPDSNTTWIS